ncbi:hypothetical protein E9993_20220 [Labilibacter sediminis]|nr:hypothetical protein E9993_20220 [Labilibacter sediminis]
MRKLSIITKFAFICIFLTSIFSSVKSQTKKEIQFSLDTLQRAYNSLEEENKTLQKEWKIQNQFFEHVKSSLLPASDINLSVDEALIKFDDIINMQKNTADSLVSANSILSDSLVKVNENNDKLIQENESYSNLLMSSLNKASFPKSQKEFIGVWDLFLDPVQISGEPFESGIISYNHFVDNDSIMKHNIYKIEFSADDIATLYFTGGIEQKCFYSIKDFSINSPYIIRFSKQDEFKLTMQISTLPSGLVASYEIPDKSEKVIYFYGLMKK